jgi:glucokinase
MAKHEDSLPFPILVGDIGGTNARFSIILDALAEPRQFPVVQTADHAGIDEAIQKSVLDKTSVQPRSAILAVAGPIRGDEIPLTNCGWVVRPREMLAGLGLEDMIVINDFEAQALAVASLSDADRVKIGNGTEIPTGSKAVLGPGTGLGVAGLVHAQHTWIPVPGEGGHVDVGPRTPRDFEIFPHLDRIEGRISAEQLLCGRGLVTIYTAVATADGVPADLADPAEISTAALAGTDPSAADAVSLFVTYLGRIAGDMALIFMARGGVYLAGGISQKILPALQRPEFRAAFEDKAPHSALLKSIPTYVLIHPLAALAGLAAFARMPGRFGVETEGRRWRR